MSRYLAARYRQMSQDQIPGNPKLSKDFDGKAYFNVLKVFDICLELPGDSEKYFGFVDDEFSEIVYTRKLPCRFAVLSHYLWLDPPV